MHYTTGHFSMLQLFADVWQPYTGPHGGRGWRNSATGTIIYGEKPGEREPAKPDEPSGTGISSSEATASKHAPLFNLADKTAIQIAAHIQELMKSQKATPTKEPKSKPGPYPKTGSDVTIGSDTYKVKGYGRMYYGKFQKFEQDPTKKTLPGGEVMVVQVEGPNGIEEMNVKKFAKMIGGGTSKPSVETPSIPQPSSSSSKFTNPHDAQLGYVKSLPQIIKSDLEAYTGAAHEKLNKTMRECPPDFTCIQDFKMKDRYRNIQKALDEAPKFDSPVKVNRGLDVKPDKARQIVEVAKQLMDHGGEMSFPSFTSTSTGSSFSGTVTYEITAKSGLSLRSLSEYESEDEILLSPKSKYKVANVDVDRWKIHLVEV